MRSHGTHSSNTSATSEKKWWPLLSILLLPGANAGWTSDAGWAAAVGWARVVKREVDPSSAFTRSPRAPPLVVHRQPLTRRSACTPSHSRARRSARTSACG
ncbi:hypothetical protein C8J57DRAFT_1343105 [Mycena rebaudengoi]|nr:hypothetical protein C8J57DRAFT_1343105 [Mycena rebaudengoi]